MAANAVDETSTCGDSTPTGKTGKGTSIGPVNKSTRVSRCSIWKPARDRCKRERNFDLRTLFSRFGKLLFALLKATVGLRLTAVHDPSDLLV